MPLRRLLPFLFLVLLPAQALAQTNNPPVITTTNNSFNVNENEFANFITTATDADEDQLTYTFTVSAGSVDLLFPGPIVREQGQSVANQFTVPPGTLGGPAIEVTVDVSDGTDSDQIVFTFNVTGVNTAPVVDISAEQAGNTQGTPTNPFQPGQISLQADITDPDNEGGYGYLWGVSPGFTSCGNTNVFFQAEGPDPTLSIGRVSSATNFTITLTILDGAHRIAQQRVVTVAPAAGGCQSASSPPPGQDSTARSCSSCGGNLAPRVDAGPATWTSQSGQRITLEGFGEDPDSGLPPNQVAFGATWSVIDSQGLNLFFGSPTSLETTLDLPVVQAPVTVTLELRLVDFSFCACADTMDLTISPSGAPPQNNPPSVQISTPSTVTTGQNILLSAQADDPDDDPLTFNWFVSSTAGIKGVLFDESLNTSYTAPNNPTTLFFTLEVSDGMEIVSRQATVTVAPSGSSNQLPQPVATADKTMARSGETVTLDGSASTDPDGDELSFLWSSDFRNPVAVVLNSESADNSIVSFLAPDVAELTELIFILTVDDGQGVAVSAQVMVSIEPNAPPTIDSISGQPVVDGEVHLTASSGSQVSLAAVASDPDGQPLSFDWSQLEGPVVQIDGADQAVASFVAPNTESVVVVVLILSVSDGVSTTEVAVSIRLVPPTVAFSQLALGGGFEVIVFAFNSTDELWSGRAILGQGNDQDWQGALSLNGTDLSGASEFQINLDAKSTRKYVLKGDAELRAGFMRIRGSDGSSAADLVVSFFYNFLVGGTLVDSTGVAPSSPGKNFTFTVEKTALVDTGFAFVSSIVTDPFQIRVILIDENGNQVQEKVITYSGHEARFFSRVFDEIPDGFIGNVTLESEEELFLVVLRVETTPTGVELTSIPATILDN